MRNRAISAIHNLGGRITERIGVPRRILLGFLAIAALLFAFTRLASKVLEGETLAFDRWILLILRDPADPAVPIGPPWLTRFMTDVTALGSFSVLAVITACVAGYFLVTRNTATAALIAISVISGSVISTELKAWFLRPRPNVVPHLVQVQSASFPSGHAMNAAVTFLTLGALLASAEADRRIRVYLMSAAVGLTLLVGFSRVYLGVHWPSDVLAGWAVGSAWALVWANLVHRTGRAWRRRPT